MASGIFAVLDDIAALMDDVAVASKLATKKTAGILGDDLAVKTRKKQPDFYLHAKFPFYGRSPKDHFSTN